MPKSIMILLAVTVAALHVGLSPALADGHDEPKAVLITGASSGIGRVTAERSRRLLL